MARLKAIEKPKPASDLADGSGRKRYASEGWQICSRCKEKSTGHRSGLCMPCRKSTALKDFK